jgi:hypothetical protein
MVLPVILEAFYRLQTENESLSAEVDRHVQRVDPDRERLGVPARAVSQRVQLRCSVFPCLEGYGKPAPIASRFLWRLRHNTGHFPRGPRLRGRTKPLKDHTVIQGRLKALRIEARGGAVGAGRSRPQRMSWGRLCDAPVNVVTPT